MTDTPVVPPPPPPPPPAPDTPIRRFTDSGIQASIDRALESLPPGASGAVVAYANTDGARLAAFARLNERWSLVGVLEKPFSGPLQGEAAVRFQW